MEWPSLEGVSFQSKPLAFEGVANEPPLFFFKLPLSYSPFYGEYGLEFVVHPSCKEGQNPNDVERTVLDLSGHVSETPSYSKR
jgi:hypothetical protein